MMLENATFSPIPMADSHQEVPVYLRFTPEELQLLQSAVSDRCEVLRHEIDRLRHPGGSSQAMNLCRKRAELETLLYRMSSGTDVVSRAA